MLGEVLLLPRETGKQAPAQSALLELAASQRLHGSPHAPAHL